MEEPPSKVRNRIDVQPTMFGYSAQLDESDVIYHMTREEVISVEFNRKEIIERMLAARNVPAELRGNKFTDKRFSNYIVLMLGMTTIPGQRRKIKTCGSRKHIFEPEGVNTIE